jgi:transglutaminase-like putative cysteine protease
MAPPPSADHRRTVDEAAMVEELVYHGWAYEVRAGRKRDAVEAATKTLERWRGLGLGYRVVDQQRFYDNTEVCNFIRWSCQIGKDTTWLDHSMATSRKLSPVPDDPHLPGGGGHYDPTVFDVDLTYRVAATPHAPATIVMPLPYHDVSQRDISWELADVAGFHAEPTQERQRLYLRLDPAWQRESCARLRIRFTSYRSWFSLDGTAVVPADRDTQRFTRDRELSQVVVTERVRDLAKELAAGAREPSEVIARLQEFMFRKLRSGWIYQEDVPASDPLSYVLDGGWYDCFSGSALFVALGRVLGIPGRVVGGYMLYETAPSLHYWAELYLSPHGWIPFDLLSWHLSGGVLEDTAWSQSTMAKLDHRLKLQLFPMIMTPLVGGAFSVPHQISDHLTNDGAAFVVRTRETLQQLAMVEVSVRRARAADPLAHRGPP